MSNNEISRELFEAFEDVRRSGLYNTFERRNIIDTIRYDTGLEMSKDQYEIILKNYVELKEKFRKEDIEAEKDRADIEEASRGQY